MGDGDDGPTDSNTFDSSLNAHFGRRVQGGSSLIQNENSGILDQGTRQRNPLLLSTTDQISTGANHCAIAFLELFDEAICIGQQSSIFNEVHDLSCLISVFQCGG